MKRRDFLRGVAVVGVASVLEPMADAPAFAMAPRHGTTRLDEGWRFHPGDVQGAESPGFDDAAWDRVSLPHSARIEALVTGEPGSPTAQWQGLCWYRLPLRLDDSVAGRTVLLHFEAAMNVADVWLDGEPAGRHLGGFLPFVLDVSDRVRPGGTVVLAVRLDNRDDPVTGPKPLGQLDFNMFHGLYRYVHLVVKDRLHITDPLLADRPASGGVFVIFPQVSARAASIRVQTHVRNAHASARTFRVRTTLQRSDGTTIATHTSRPVTLPPGSHRDIVQSLEVSAPRLWSPRAPNMHVVLSEIVVGDRVVDAESTRIGIRRIEIARDGFRINGERMFLRGTNRHQEHPYVGYAVPADAQYRDARRIKDAGFDYIRLSHYPHAPAFMDACDELGLVVMDCIPGWQYFGADPAFAELQYRNCRDMIRRDRNHPSVILWEVSLNETAMPPEFIARTHEIAHEEYPGDQCFTCGWTRGYDVYIRARQHGGCPAVTDYPCVVSEYGDWEYYAMTAGLDQDDWRELAPDESTSRQLRWHGERALLQQARNFQEAHNDNRGSAAFADGLWVMYDYTRGYSPDIESSGCADIFRLPKYSYHFFRSQRPPDELPGRHSAGPMVFIASAWTPASATSIRVFSNCDEVELRLNGLLIERRPPDADRMSGRLAHPPFTFTVAGFGAGSLEAVGLIGGREAARHAVRTPGAIERLMLSLDLSGRSTSIRAKDLIFCHASLEDSQGTIVPDAWENVAFSAWGGASLIGTNPFSSDAGIASILLATRPGGAPAGARAMSIVRVGGAARILGAAVAVAGRAEPFAIHYTVDGSMPGAGSPRYTGRPVRSAVPLRAAILVDGRTVLLLDEGVEKFRIRGSAAPATREAFRRG